MRKLTNRRSALLLILLLLGPLKALAEEGGEAAISSESIALTPENFTVYKGPFCFCCKRWIKHLEHEGVKPEVVTTGKMSEIKGQWAVPDGLHSCHTAVWNQRYVFEGHVPARYIRQFLSNPPANAVGLTVPGMPEGSPGMYEGKNFEPYNIYLLLRGGDYEFYARVDRPEAE